MIKYIFLTGLVAFFSWFLTLLFLIKFKDIFVDIPNERSSHSEKTPNSGGIIIVLLTILGSLFSGNYSIILCLPLAIIGFLDDHFKISSFKRFSVQFFTVNFLLLNSKNFINYFLTGGLIINIFIYSFILLIGLSIINFSNFIDGIDGLLAGCMLIGFIFCSIIIDSSYLYLVGSITGFLIWNWNPARIFMGDIGSTFLGAVFFNSLINANNYYEALSLLFLINPILMDSISCLIRRFINKENIFTAHKKHLYQRLHQAGWKHSKVSLLYIIGTLIMSFCIFHKNIYFLGLLILTEFIIGYLLDKNIAVSFKTEGTY